MRLLPLVAGILCPHLCAAQSAAIAVDRFVSAPGPASFLQVEGSAVPGARELLFTSAFWAVSQPLALRDPQTGEPIFVPVRTRVSLDLGGELGITNRFSLGLGWPLSLWQEGDRPMSGTSGMLRTTEVGDIRLRARMEILPGARVSLGGGLELTLPGGGQGSFAASSSPTMATRLILSWHQAIFAAAVNATARFAAPQQFYEVSLGHNLEWGAAAQVALPRLFTLRPSLIAEATGLIGLHAPGLVYPVEVRGALRLGTGCLMIDLSGGGGVTDAPLSGRWRALLIVRGQIAGPGKRQVRANSS